METAAGAHLDLAKQLLGHAFQDLLQLSFHGLGAVCVQLLPLLLRVHPQPCMQINAINDLHSSGRCLLCLLGVFPATISIQGLPDPACNQTQSIQVLSHMHDMPADDYQQAPGGRAATTCPQTSRCLLTLPGAWVKKSHAEAPSTWSN